MKPIIVLLPISFLPLFSFGKELPQACFPSAQEVRDAKQALEKAERKYNTNCKKHTRSIASHSYKKLLNDRWYYYQWKNTCDTSKNYSISELNKQIKRIDKQIDDRIKNTIHGKAYNAFRNRLEELYKLRDSNPKQFKTQDIQTEIHKLETAIRIDKQELSRITLHLQSARQKLVNKKYKDDGPCGKDSPDPEVYKAYNKYLSKDTKCDKLDREVLHKRSNYIITQSKYNDSTNKITIPREPTNSKSGSGSVK